MKRLTKTIFAIFLTTLLSACGGGGGGGGGGVGPSYTVDYTADNAPFTGTVTLQKSSTSGSVVYIDVIASSIDGLYGADIKIDYDHASVTWEGSQQVGEEFEGGLNDIGLYGGSEGRLVLGVARSTGSGGLTSDAGDVVITTIPFRVIAIGESAISFSIDSRLTDSESPSPGTLTVNSWDGGTFSGI